MREGTMTRDGNETWYRIGGDLESGLVPVVICHGGPGAAHDYTEPIAELSREGRGCVLYDQVGCGRSTHLPDAPAEFWTVQLFKDELVDLTRHLGIAERYAVVGQSWGGMLALEHALDHPSGLQAIVVADSPASIPLWVAEANRLREDLPPGGFHRGDGQTRLVGREEGPGILPARADRPGAGDSRAGLQDHDLSPAAEAALRFLGGCGPPRRPGGAHSGVVRFCGQGGCLCLETA